MRYNAKWRGVTCSAEDCDRQAEKRGWCQKHYRRWQCHGHLEVTRIFGDDAARFWSKVDKSGPCWAWLGSCDDKGYGWFKVEDHMRRAHRVAYQMLIGPVPDGRELHHECRNESCVNPGHLIPLTDQEHSDRHKGGRDVPTAGFV